MREVPQPLDARIDFARTNKKSEPNCYGTAFFLLGILPYDMVVFTNRKYVWRALEFLEEKPGPTDNSLIISRTSEGNLRHASFIRDAATFQGFHREGSGGYFSEFKELADIETYLNAAESGVFRKKNEWKHSYHRLPSQPDEELVQNWVKDVVESYSPCW